jgi:hypothetical protein
MKRSTILSTICFSMFVAGALNAQEVPRLAFQVGAGFTNPVGGTGRNLDIGWNTGIGVGVNFSQWVGLMVQADYNRMGVNSGALNTIGFPGGDVNVFSATLDPIVHLTPRGHFDLYVIGGGGLYRQTQEFTAPSVATLAGYDPFFGFYRASVPTNVLLESYTVNKPGVNVGAGIAMGTKWRGKFFAEARYNRIFINSSTRTDYIPVTFGFRW